MAAPEPKLILALPGNKTLSLPVKTALYKLWRLLTYPICVGAGYYLLGTDGAIYTALVLILTNRGQL